MIRLSLPIPPSLNNAYVNARRGRVPSMAHGEWKALAGWEVSCQKPQKIIGPYRLAISLPWAMRGDVSNRIKLAEDLLVAMHVISDDHNAVWVCAQRSKDVKADRCLIEVEEALTVDKVQL